MMEYKGYIGVTEVDEEAGLLHGEVANTRDVITFQAKSMDELRVAFEDSVEDYLEFCTARGESPDKPLSGRFLVRIHPDLHRKIYAEAKRRHRSLNALVAEVLEEAVSR